MTPAAEKRWFAAVAEIGNCVLCGKHGVQVSHSNMLRKMEEPDALAVTLKRLEPR